MGTMGTVIAIVLMAVAAAIIFVFLLIPLVKLVGKLIGHVVKTLVDIVADALRIVGSILVIPVFMLLTVGSVVFGRWSATGHYGRAVSSEIKSAGLNLYRVAIGHPLRLIGLGLVIDGFEKRLPEVVAAAPGRDKPKGRKGQFDGYTIVGSLAGGGSGARLYIAEPDDMKRAGFQRQGIDAQQVVIKAFSLNEGSSLPQIIRESRSLEAAKRLGLVLEHDLTQERFHYVMQYVPGEQLTLITQRAHTDSGQAGLNDKQLSKLLSHGRDLLSTLSVYHSGGLWHKDVKPDNVVVDETGAHLVDLGLITPLRSAMTLTTHGTEYFRDPELVRMALKGVKVNEVDGAKFDIYAAAAVLYSMVENSFPAHGGLSQITRRCPEGVRWIIRRGMTDYDKRYSSMNEMLADLDYVLGHQDQFAVKPASLPSMNGSRAEPLDPVHDENDAFLESVAAARAAAPSPRGRHTAVPPPVDNEAKAKKPSGKPKIMVASWWTGRSALDKPDIHSIAAEVVDFAENISDAAVGVAASVQAVAKNPMPKSVANKSAGEQIKDARSRAKDRQHNARKRAASHRNKVKKNSRSGINHGAAVAIGVVVGIASIPVAFALLPSSNQSQQQTKVTTLNDDGSMSIAINGQTVFQGNKDDHKDMIAELGSKSRGKAVVLSMFSMPLESETKSRLEKNIAALRDAGFETIDNIRFDGQADIPTDERDTLLAGLRKKRDLASTDTEDAGYALKKWLKNLDEEYSLVVVLEPAPKSSPKEPDTFVSLAAGRYSSVSTIEPTTREFLEDALEATGKDW
jgi:hypothetical protein